jgi:hypothetical protein
MKKCPFLAGESTFSSKTADGVCSSLSGLLGPRARAKHPNTASTLSAHRNWNMTLAMDTSRRLNLTPFPPTQIHADRRTCVEYVTAENTKTLAGSERDTFSVTLDEMPDPH